MKKLSTTWRHQKALSANQGHSSKQNEQLQQNLSRQQLGKLPIASASGTVKLSLTGNSKTITTPSYTTDDLKNEDFPSSFLSTFSSSLNNDLIKELEKVEAAFGNEINKSRTKPDSFSVSKYNLSKELNAMDLKPTLDNAGNKTTGKRKYFKESAVNTSEAHSASTISGKHSVVHNHKTTLSSVVSPTNSPTDKRPKHTNRTLQDQNLNNSKKESHICTSSKSPVQRNNASFCPNDNLNDNGASFNFSDITFSPISSTLSGDRDIIDISEDESPRIKQSVCRGLSRNSVQYNKEGKVSSQKEHLAEHYKTLRSDTSAKCMRRIETRKVKPSVLSQEKSCQFKNISTDVVTIKKCRSQNKIQLNRSKISVSICDEAKTNCNSYEDSNQQLFVASQSFSECENNQISRSTHIRSSASNKSQQQNLKSGCHSNYNVSDKEKDSRVTASETSRNCPKGQSNLSSNTGHTNMMQENSFGNTSITADKRQLSSWGLPEPVLEAYKNHGVETMFEWQAECLLTDNVLDGGNLVYSAPTSAGKTLVAELLILKRVLESRKKALFILPFVSVVREKMYSLQQLFQNAGIRVGGYMGSHSPPGGFQHVHVAVCTIEKGNGLINRLMEEGKLGELGAVVIDELHMVGDSHRGYLLELMLTKLAYIVQRTKDGSSDCQVQIIGMSATLPNLPLLAKWLNASLYCTDYRPVPLTEYIKVDNKIFNGQLIIERNISSLLISPDDADHVVALCIETVSEGHGVLVFCPTKNWCEKLCEAIARKFYTLLSHDQTAGNTGSNGVSDSTSVGIFRINLDRSSLMETIEQLRRCPVGLDPMLGKCVLNGVAYHHAGLTFDERDIIEGAFRQGNLKVIVATSTLSSGVNLPARRVIIRTPLFYGKIIDTLTYKQMVGRAGRKGIDTEGESILICKSQEKNVGKKLIESELPPVESCLHFDTTDGLSGSLKRAILEVVVSGVATTPTDVSAYVNCTLLSASLSECSQNNLNATLTEICIKFLQENEFVTVNVTRNEDGTESRKFYPTQLGSAILASSLSPDEGLLVFAELQKARKAFVLDTELHIIYLVTPVYASDVSASIDWYHYHHYWETLTPADRRVADLVGISESFIARAIQGRISGKTEAQRKTLAIHQRFYTALVLNCLIQESPLMEVAAKFNYNKGQLQSLQQSASTFAGMITVFCGRLGWHSLELILSQFHKRLSFGVQQELVDLVRISVLNASSARMLYNAGYYTVTDVARAEIADIENLFRNTAPFQSDKRQEGETDWELKERRRARCIWLTGRKGVTELDAAIAVIEEAKVIVQGDLGVSGINWGKEDKNVADYSEKQEESTVSEGHFEMSRGLNKDDRSIFADSPKTHGLELKVNTTIVEIESEVSADRIGTAMEKQKNVMRQIQTNSNNKKVLAEGLSQRKLSNTSRNSSNGSFRKSGSSISCHVKCNERSFFGQTVVSPPEGVKNLMNDTVNNIRGNATVCDRFNNSGTSAHDEIISDGRSLLGVNNLTAIENLNKQSEIPVVKENCTVPSLPAESDSEAIHGTAVTSSHFSLECIRDNLKLCAAVSREESVQHEMNISNLSFAFSDSFEIDTQTAYIINHDGQGIERNQQTTTIGLRCDSPLASKYTLSNSFPKVKVCQTSKSPVSTYGTKLLIDENVITMNIVLDHNNERASPDPFLDSMSEALLFDYENVEQETPQRKSTTNNHSENVPEIFTESLFDSPEILQQEIVMSDECTPKRTIAKTVHFLKSCPDKLFVENKVVQLNTENHNCETLSESLMLLQNFKDKIVHHKHKTVQGHCDGEELYSSLTSSNICEQRMHLDDGMLEIEASLPKQINYYSCDDLHIIEAAGVLSTNKVLTKCTDKNLQDVISKASCQHVEKENKKSIGKVTKGIAFHSKPKNFITDSYKNGFLTSHNKDYSSFFVSSQSPKKQTVSRNPMSFPQSSTPLTNEIIKAQNHKVASQVKDTSEGQTPVTPVLEKHVTCENAFIYEQDTKFHTKTTNLSELDEYFCGSFSLSLMDRAMKECDGIPEANFHKITTNICDVNCSTIFVRSNETENEIDCTNIQHYLDDAQLPPSKNFTDPQSNNSSRNDGSDCVPPTPPDEISNAASPFRMSFYTPLKPKVSAASNSILTPKRDIPKQLRNKQAKINFTTIKDKKIPQDATSASHLNLNGEVSDSHHSDSCSKNLHLAKPSHCSSLKYDPAKRISKHSITSADVINAVSTSENMPVESSSNKNNQSLSASQLLSQQSFTIVDVCANKQLFETFITEVKSKPYIALSVACEKKPPESKERVTSEIGARFLRKRTSLPISKPQKAVGIPVPDSEAFIVGLAISWENRDSYFVSLMPVDNIQLPSSPDLSHSLSEPPLDETLTQEERIKALAEVFSSRPGNNETTVAAYDSKATFVCLAKTLGLSLSKCEDPCVATWLREPCAKVKNLHQMVVSHCPEELGLLDAIGGGVNGYQSMGSDINSRVNGRLRACTESVLSRKLMDKFHILLSDDHLLTAFTDVEMPAIITLARMELNGFGISEQEIEQQKTLLTSKLNILEEQAYKMAGHTFSLNSFTDVATVFYRELKLPINGDPTLVPHLPTYGRKRKCANGGTGKEILEKLQKFHPLPAVILEWRRLSSALTKSLFPLQKAARPCPHLDMVRVYGDCQIFTSTGRVSMAEPNLQNIPKDFAINLSYSIGEVENAATSSNDKAVKGISALNSDKLEAKNVHLQYAASTPVSMRKIFIPFREGVIMAADYSQIELRVIAHLSGDSKLASILNTPEGDVFKIIAAQMNGLDISEVSSEQRQQAKQVCYGMLYGIGPKALAEQLGMDENDADVFMETFKSKYPAVRKYLHRTVEFCQKNGYVKTLFNRRRYLPSIKCSNPNARAQAERQAVNTSIQGSASDLVKVAMTNIDRKLMELFPNTQKCHSQSFLNRGLPDRRNLNTPSVNGAYLVLQLHDELIYEIIITIMNFFIASFAMSNETLIIIPAEAELKCIVHYPFPTIYVCEAMVSKQISVYTVYKNEDQRTFCGRCKAT